MDVVSELLSTVRLTGGGFLRADLHAPFALETMNGRDTCSAFGRDFGQVIPYHVVTRGDCWVRVAGEPPVLARSGTVLLLPRGEAHVLASAADARPVSVRTLMPGHITRHPIVLSVPGSGACTQLICGYLACDRRPWNPLLEALPRLMAIELGDGAIFSWVSSSFEYALLESDSPRLGTDSQLARVSELLFVEALRRYLDQMPPSTAGWLAALKDRHVGPAIARLHADPARSWTVADLASEVGLSRSAFAQRFQEKAGMPPLEYLTRWRMQVAARLLRETARPVLSIALETGYQSDAAFIRAFKREFGMTPSRWRRSPQAGPA